MSVRGLPDVTVEWVSIWSVNIVRLILRTPDGSDGWHWWVHRLGPVRMQCTRVELDKGTSTRQHTMAH